MSEARLRSVRLVVAIALIAAAFAQARSLLQEMRSAARLRTVVIAAVRDSTVAALPDLEGAAGRGIDGWNDVATRLMERGLATEVQVFDLGGRVLFSRPVDPSVQHWPAPSELAGLERQAMTFAVSAGANERVLTYVAIGAPSARLILRVAVRDHNLESDDRERFAGLVAHYLTLGLLGFAGIVALWPIRTREAQAAPRALHAYEEAMGRLRERGDEEHRRHEEERQQMADALHDSEAMALAGELTAAIVHEVRNGLGTILGYARLIERSEDAAKDRAHAACIREECGGLETVVRAFVEFIRQVEPREGTVDVGRLLSRVAAREGRGPEDGDVRLSIPEGLPLLDADEDLLERALGNLVRNAREAAGPQGVVRVEARAEGDWLRIEVLDDGPGPTDEAVSTKRRFYTSKPRGLGLGLPMVRKIVGLMGGTFELLKAAPRGGLARVLLPSRPASRRA